MADGLVRAHIRVVEGSGEEEGAITGGWMTSILRDGTRNLSPPIVEEKEKEAAPEEAVVVAQPPATEEPPPSTSLARAPTAIAEVEAAPSPAADARCNKFLKRLKLNY